MCRHRAVSCCDVHTYHYSLQVISLRISVTTNTPMMVRRRRTSRAILAYTAPAMPSLTVKSGDYIHIDNSIMVKNAVHVLSFTYMYVYLHKVW